MWFGQIHFTNLLSKTKGNILLKKTWIKGHVQ